MDIRHLSAALLLTLGAFSATWADDRTEAVIGGAAGGAVGAAVGHELGDREGAIVGAAVGAAVGTAVATSGDDDDHGDGHPYARSRVEIYEIGHPHGRHCPPGQAKKGRC